MAQTARITSGTGLTWRDLWRTPEDSKRYEIIEGELVVTPSPFIDHQRVLGNLNDVVRRHVRKHRLGTVLFAPVAVVLEKVSAVEPDLLFVARARESLIENKAIFGAPDLAVEILSPASAARDRGRKRDLYARTSVAHYWVVDPRAGELTAWRLVDGAYVVEAEVGQRGTFKPSLFPGLAIRMRELLA